MLASRALSHSRLGLAVPSGRAVAVIGRCQRARHAALATGPQQSQHCPSRGHFDATAKSAGQRQHKMASLQCIRALQQEEALCTSSIEGEDVVELEIKVEGMMCGGCTSRVAEALKKMEHVRAVDVSLESKVASIEVQATTIMDALHMMPAFVEAIKDLGFEAEPHISLHPGQEYA